MKANSRTQTYLRELRLPKAERTARRAERRVEGQMRKMRENDNTPERRAAALEAERRRYQNIGGGP